MDTKLKPSYYADEMRHIVCQPYTIPNLHLMAEDLGIHRHWFHRDHYDIPKRQVDRLRNDPRVIFVSPKIILNIIRLEI